ncbi:CoA transferase [Vandammella animalimorsus]|uniref:CoA transferase n=1 Tax=Vandammella animalimorsus TaxID=2029117 RepID=UPI0031BA7E49
MSVASSHPHTSTEQPAAAGPLAGVRILSLALNLPGPAALMRLAGMGAHCTKLEAPAPAGASTSDPMGQYDPAAYAQMHTGVQRVQADLKSPAGQAQLQTLLEHCDVLLTSFRPAAMKKLGVDWGTLQARYPGLSLVQIFGAAGERANEAGHDLSYQAEAGLVPDLHMPPSLLADMAGALMASEAVLQALLARQADGRGRCIEVSLLDAAHWLALPRVWGICAPQGMTGGAHAGYRLYPCADGRVAMAALEPHFAQRLWQQVCSAAGDAQMPSAPGAEGDMLAAGTHEAVAAFCAARRCAELDAMAQAHDIPLLTMPD